MFTLFFIAISFNSNNGMVGENGLAKFWEMFEIDREVVRCILNITTAMKIILFINDTFLRLIE